MDVKNYKSNKYFSIKLLLILVLLTIISIKETKARRLLEHSPHSNSIASLREESEANFTTQILNSKHLSPADEDHDETTMMSKRKHRRPSTSRHPLLFDWTSSCGTCDPEMCEEPPVDCTTGLIRDACDCCYVCGNLEDTPCDLPDQTFRFGQCGRDLVCVPQENIAGEADAYCACASRTVVCGNDGRTYSNPCRFKRASGRKPSLRKSHEGPCLAAPLMEIPPMNQTAESGSSAVFSCSVSGYPFAFFEWMKNGDSVFQPGSENDIVIQVRSGPLKYQVTTWLEIEKVYPPHSGFYTCVAKNQYGQVNATARLEVIGGEFDQSYYAYRGKQYEFAKETREASSEWTSANSYSSSYLRGHTIPETDSVLAFSEVGNDVSDLTLETSAGHEETASIRKSGDVNSSKNGNNEEINVMLAKTLKKLVQPKQFKDIFFDDDDFSDGSGNDIQ